jgi:signal transduction histidine kinase/CheY-like chemotaxis protein
MSSARLGFNKMKNRIIVNPEDIRCGNVHSDTVEEIRPSEDIESGVNHEEKQSDFPEALENFISHQEDYKTSKKELLNVSSLWPIMVVFHVATATRISLERSGSGGPLFLAGYIIQWVEYAIFISYIVAQVVTAMTPNTQRYRFACLFCRRYLKKAFGGRIEDVMGIVGTILHGIYLLARVHVGECKNGTDIFESQYCNPVAASNSIPHDQVLLLYSIPIVCQCLFRGISVEALVTCWIATVFFVLYALIEVRGWRQIWTLAYAILFMNISYEMERSYRVLFVQRMKVAYSAEVTERHKLNMQAKSLSIESKLREREALQLRSLMGNVAHDLKTPLHSLEADLEVLNAFISQIPRNLLEKVSADFQRKCGGEILDPRSILQSLNSTCKFMGMAINRSQDFMRASNNIPLVPTIETVDLKAAINMSVACINQLQTVRPIIAHPLELGICSHIITDKHWLSENVLCLLSNAIKFGGSGVVDVRVQVINSTIRKSASYGVFTSLFSVNGKVTDLSLSGKSDKDLFNAVPLACDDKIPPPPFNGQEMVLVTVEDTGVGITDEDRNILFQPLKQTQRGVGGAGLGLFCLSKRTEALGGTAGVTSRTDGKQGSMFWFTFPYKPDFVLAKVDAYIDAVSIEEDKPMNLLKPRRVLIVDDSLSILKVTSRLLKINGHTATTAANGLIGLQMLKNSMVNDDFDMVLTDIQMPIMDGIEATVLFRQFEKELMEKENKPLPGCDMQRGRKKMLIIGMSATTDDHSRLQALNAGVDFFIPKPFAYKDLQLLLSSATA